MTANRKQFQVIRQASDEDDREFRKRIDAILNDGWEIINCSTEERQYGLSTAIVFLKR